MFVKTGIFGGQYRELYVTRNLFDGNDSATLREEFGEGRAVSREDASHLRRIVAAPQFGNRWQLPLKATHDDIKRGRSYEARENCDARYPSEYPKNQRHETPPKRRIATNAMPAPSITNPTARPTIAGVDITREGPRPVPRRLTTADGRAES